MDNLLQRCQQRTPARAGSAGFGLVEAVMASSIALIGLTVAAQALVSLARTQARAAVISDARDALDLARAVVRSQAVPPSWSGDALVTARPLPIPEGCSLRVTDTANAPAALAVEALCGRGEFKAQADGWVTWLPAPEPTAPEPTAP